MTTVVTKIKTDGTVKSRLCLRGDRIPSIDQPFASAPTVSRDFLKVFCGLFVNLPHFSWTQVDISKAFTQADLFHARDRIVARVPDFVGINGYQFHGHIALSNKADLFEKGLQSSDPLYSKTKATICPGFKSLPHEYAIGLNRPLYGSHDAPLRWHLTITKALLRYKFLPLHVDKCVFACHIPADDANHPLAFHGKIVAALVLVHVDDIIFIGDKVRKEWFKRCIDEFEHGEFEELTPISALKFCGISISITPDRRLSLSQEEFYDKIMPLHIRDFVLNNELVLERKVAIKRFKSLVGCLIWVMSTRFDIIFGVIQLASSLLDSVCDVKKMIEFVSTANKVISRVKNKHRSLSLVPFIRKEHWGRKVQIIAFSDASFGTLRNHGSVEGYCAFMATPIKRDGAALCQGNLLVFYGRKISRVSRSTAHTEGIALRNASDTTLYLQCLMEEVMSGEFRTSFLRKSEDLVPVISLFAWLGIFPFKMRRR